MKKRIAILASRDYGPLTPYPDDALLCESFNSLGHEAQIVCWDDEDINYTQYDCAIVRACWDYDRRLSEFLGVLSHINRQTALFNSYPVILENTNKRYLLELEKSGVPIVPSIFFDDIEKLYVPDEWHKLVVKPAVSASGKDTSLHLATDIDSIQAAAAEILNQGKSILLQEYLPSVEEYGERSSVIIAGRTTFTMKKTPKTGGFLVHIHHGGSYTKVDIAEDEKRFLELLLSKISIVPLYMRVDYLRRSDNTICLLELEQIEPNLYLRQNKEGLKLLTQETLKRI